MAYCYKYLKISVEYKRSILKKKILTMKIYTVKHPSRFADDFFEWLGEIDISNEKKIIMPQQITYFIAR